MDSSNYIPLRVRALLRAPVVSDRWLPLDGILYYHALRMAGCAPDALLSGRMDQQVELPLARVGTGPDWFYACSWSQPQPWWSAESKTYWTNHFDSAYAPGLVDFGKRRGLVQTNGGEYKAKKMPVFYRVAREITWYCLGDPGTIRALLSCVTHIGKYLVQGWGRVMRWEVEYVDEDWSVWMNGRLTRGVPARLAPDHSRTEYYGLRPPYFDRRNQFPLAVPA